MDDENCLNCRFFYTTNNGNTCKRYPPTVYPHPAENALGQPVMSVICVEPQVIPENFCGEFQEASPLLQVVP